MKASARREKTEFTRHKQRCDDIGKRVKQNDEKLQRNCQLPYMVANIGEILEPEEEEDDSKDGTGFAVKTGNTGQEKKQKAIVVKTTGRHTVYLPVPGMVEAEDLKPGELVAVGKESFLVYEKLPAEYDSRVMAMELDEKPKEDYTDVGGLDKQIEELTEAIVLPMTHKERFINLGIRPPKGLLMHGPPGTGKTLMARACAA